MANSINPTLRSLARFTAIDAMLRYGIDWHNPNLRPELIVSDGPGALDLWGLALEAGRSLSVEDRVAVLRGTVASEFFSLSGSAGVQDMLSHSIGDVALAIALVAQLMQVRVIPGYKHKSG